MTDVFAQADRVLRASRAMRLAKRAADRGRYARARRLLEAGEQALAEYREGEASNARDHRLDR